MTIDQQYIDKLLAYCRDIMMPNTQVEISKLTDNPEKFIDTIKILIDSKLAPYLEFSSDYKILRKMEGYMEKGSYIWLSKKNKICHQNWAEDKQK